MKLLFIFISKLLLVYICCFSFSLNAKDIVIGASLNLTGVNAQYSIDYKNAIEAYLESYNKLDKLKKYQLKLLVLDDQGVASRATDNIERLIIRKQVIAVINPYYGVVGNKIIQTAVKLETLVISSAFAPKGARDTKAKKRYSYYFSTLDFFSHQVVNQLFAELSISSDKLFYFTDKKIIARIKIVDKYIENYIENYIDKPITDLPEGAVIIIHENYAEGALFINEAVKHRPDFYFIIQPNIGAEALIALVDKNAIKSIRFITDIPVHQQQQPLLQEASKVFSKYNEPILLNSQSVKGFLSAKIVAQAVFNVVNALQADSLIDVVTLPFQVLERVVGWVKHSTSDLDRELVIDEIRNLKFFDIGLEQRVNQEKNGLGLSRLWLLVISDGQLVLRGNE